MAKLFRSLEDQELKAVFLDRFRNSAEFQWHFHCSLALWETK